MITGKGQSITLMAGKTYADSWQIRRDLVSGLESGDSVAMTFRRAQGDTVLLTVAATGFDYATGEFDVALSPANIATIRSGLGLAAQERGTCSVGVARTRSGTTISIARFTAILEPEA